MGPRVGTGFGTEQGDLSAALVELNCETDFVALRAHNASLVINVVC